MEGKVAVDGGKGGLPMEGKVEGASCRTRTKSGDDQVPMGFEPTLRG